MKRLTQIISLPAVAALLFLLTALAAFPRAAAAQAQAQRSGVSRSMEQAIRLYHEGEDSEAMDRFMDILVKGSPSEKALANEYIGKITLRMNSGVHTMKDADSEANSMNSVKGDIGPGSGRKAAAAPADYGDEEEEGDSAAAQKERITEKINAKLAQMRRDLLLELSNSDSVKVYMGDNVPKAITLDTDFFFASETSFRSGTDKMLSLVAGLIFTMGKVNCLILPEGAAGGDVKIKGIRRALALNSYLDARGVSKARLEVNLTGSDVKFPKELSNVSGLIIIFEYDKEPRLKEQDEDLQTKGPKISLGVYPTAIAVHNNEGAVVEFSVFESPAGVPSWTFNIFQVMKDGTRLQLQEIHGSGAQYNQSFWNGRSKFFGASYPSGKYIFTLTAKDIEGKETSLSRFVMVRPTPEEEKMMVTKPAVKKEEPQEEVVTKAGIKTKMVKPGAAGKAGKVLKGPKAAPARTGKAGAKKGAKGAAKPKKTEAEEGAEPQQAEAPAGKAQAPEGGAEAGQGDFPGQVTYKIYFKENTATITANSEKKLAQVAETLGYYPMANIALTGYAYSGEANAEVMAENRVNYVATKLADKYKIDRSRMNIKSSVSATPKSTVEIQMTGNE